MGGTDANAILQSGSIPDPASGLRRVVPVATTERSSEIRPAAPREFQLLGPAEIFAPLPPTKYLIPELRLASSGIALLAGYGFSGKTLCAQSIAVAVAFNRRLWGQFAVGHGRVVHFDFEQGRHLTFARYQRLAAAEGLNPADLPDTLQVAALPSLHLDSSMGIDALRRACDGSKLIIIDSARAALPSAEENSSEVRAHLDAIGRVADEVGAAALIIHHARKPTEGSPAGGKYSIRGSSGFFDASSTVYTLEGTEDSGAILRHHKCRWSGILSQPASLRWVDINMGNDPKGGLKVDYIPPEQLAAELKDRSASGEDLDMIRAHLARIGGTHRGSRTALVTAIGIRKDRGLSALATAISSGQLDEIGRGSAATISLPDEVVDEDE